MWVKILWYDSSIYFIIFHLYLDKWWIWMFLPNLILILIAKKNQSQCLSKLKWYGQPQDGLTKQTMRPPSMNTWAILTARFCDLPVKISPVGFWNQWDYKNSSSINIYLNLPELVRINYIQIEFKPLMRTLGPFGSRFVWWKVDWQNVHFVMFIDRQMRI